MRTVAHDHAASWRGLAALCSHKQKTAGFRQTPPQACATNRPDTLTRHPRRKKGIDRTDLAQCRFTAIYLQLLAPGAAPASERRKTVHALRTT